MIQFIEGGAVGFIAGAFCPSILRKIKSLFVKESKAAETAAGAGVVADIKKAL